MINKKSGVLLIAFGLIFLFNSNAAAQIKTEQVVSSNIVKVWLPSGAEKVVPETYPPEMTEMIERAVAVKGRGKWKRYDTEVLMWKGADFKKTSAATIIARLTERIKAAEWRYEPDETKSGVTLFTVTDEATGNIVVGLSIATEDGLIWAWTLVAPKS